MSNSEKGAEPNWSHNAWGEMGEEKEKDEKASGYFSEMRCIYEK